MPGIGIDPSFVDFFLFNCYVGVKSAVDIDVTSSCIVVLSETQYFLNISILSKEGLP